MTNMNQLAKEIHEAAVQKGFWDVDDIEVLEIITDPAVFDGRKPEGVAAELADFVMMVLDWAKARDEMIADPDKNFRKDSVLEFEKVTLPHLVNNMHESVMLVANDWISRPDIQFAFMVHCVASWLKARDIDLFDVIRQKMAYNESRPALHGRAY